MLQTPRGTFDILPEEQNYWKKIENTFEKIASSFGFLKIETPPFEYKEVFERGIGAVTDIVEKEMYLVKRLGSNQEENENELVLRPEGTAGVVRAYIEHGMHTRPQPVKLYYLGPMFRYERPQKGRFRVHHQFGLEIFGAASAFADAFLIGIAKTIYEEIGLSHLIFQINSLGCRNCRSKIKKATIEYLRPYQVLLCPTCQNRFLKNPLRILDCKEEKCQRIIKGAPATVDYLCSSCREHFKNVLEYLEEFELPYDFNPQLVRGLDYYTKTIFEVISKDTNIALGGGGRYDDLVEFFGGKSTPALGFAGGFERVIEEMKRQNIRPPALSGADVYLIQLGDLSKRVCLPILFNLYKNGFRVILALDKDSLRGQLKDADRLKIPFALILGQKEAKDGTIIVRNMLDGSQETVDFKKLPDFLRKRIGDEIKVKKHEEKK